MRSITSGRLAVVLALLALVVAMGGTGYAAGKIKGTQIAKNAITSKSVKNNSLTGKDIKESSLGQVPIAATAGSAATAGKATTADSATNATNATNAGTVNGVKASKVLFQVAGGTGATTIFSGSGVTVSASCAAGTNAVALTATTSVANSSIYSVANSDADPNNPTEDDLEGGNFSPATTFNCSPAAAATSMC